MVFFKTHECEKMRAAKEDIEITKYNDGWYLDITSTDDIYIHAGTNVFFCSFCNERLD